MSHQLLVWPAALLLFAGCASVNTVQNEYFGANRTIVADERIITDAGTNDIAKVVAVSVASGDLLTVQVEVVNRKTRMFEFNYKFEWYDQNGVLIQPDGPWKTRQIEAGESLMLVDTAPSPKAKDFRVKFIQPVRRNPDPSFPNTK